mgnify:CR=1 FL=1
MAYYYPEPGVGGEVGVAGDEACLVAFDSGHHGRLVLHGLGAVDEAQPEILRFFRFFLCFPAGKS